jgi:hypothetical protein
MNSFEEYRKELQTRIFNLPGSVSAFDQLTLDIFRFQAEHNAVFSKYLDLLGVDASKITSVESIPFLPIEAFKSNKVVTGQFYDEQVFKSSGTTSSISERSNHHVRSLDWYREISTSIFNGIVGPVSSYKWFGLLPGYADRGDSSLIFMVKHFMLKSGDVKSDSFFTDNYYALNDLLQMNSEEKIALIGVTHALLGWLEGDDSPSFPPELMSKLTIIETGGMKGHGKEPLRDEVHSSIRVALPNVNILSEYGMTELMSQAYSQDGKFYESPNWMKIFIKDTSDPMSVVPDGRTGRVQIIDLANIDSCAFISTSDLGKMEIDTGRFEILGRFDNSEVRGCNLLSV